MSPGLSLSAALDDDVTYRLGNFQVPGDLAMYLYGGLRFLKREPERSRRVIRLLFANWLAHAEVPELRQSRPAVRASYHYAKQTTSVLLYPTSPKAPAGARVLSPQELASWLVTINDAKPFLWNVPWPSVQTQELKELPRPGRLAGRRALSTRARSASTFRGKTWWGRTSRSLTGRRFGRARRWHGADRERFSRRRARRPGRNQLRISWTTSPWTSVRRKSRPAYR